jgi:hypothetical protein
MGMIIVKNICSLAVLSVLLLVFPAAGKCASAGVQQCLVVTGAERQRVNGTYIKEGNHHNHPKYVKGVFGIYYKEKTRGWVISRGDTVFYQNDKQTAAPPQRGWTAVSAPQAPDTKLTVLEASLLLPDASADYYLVKGAGKAAVNGIYTPCGKHETGGDQYGHDQYILYYKGCHSKWMIIDGNRNLYKNKTDSKTPPREGWETGCGEKNLDPTPTVKRVSKPCLVYSKTEFPRAKTSLYPIDNSTPAVITLPKVSGKTFSGINGDDFVLDNKVTITGLPAGLIPVITRLDENHLSVIFTGELVNCDDVIPLTFTFDDTAFSDGDASAVMNARKKDIQIIKIRLNRL